MKKSGVPEGTPPFFMPCQTTLPTNAIRGQRLPQALLLARSASSRLATLYIA